MGPAHNRDLYHFFLAQKDLFDFARVNIGPAADNEVLQSVLEGKEAIFAKRPEVSCMQPAAAQCLAVASSFFQ